MVCLAAFELFVEQEFVVVVVLVAVVLEELANSSVSTSLALKVGALPLIPGGTTELLIIYFPCVLLTI